MGKDFGKYWQGGNTLNENLLCIKNIQKGDLK